MGEDEGGGDESSCGSRPRKVFSLPLRKLLRGLTIHLLYPDFFFFLDALAAGAEPWKAYRQLYLGPNRAVLSAYASQVMRLPRNAWRERVEDVKPQHYAQLRELVQRTDLPAVSRQAIQRCQSAVRHWPNPVPPPQAALLVGFFSPDAFLFRVSGSWCIGVGLERWRNFDALPIFIAHEYGHYLRRLAVRSRRTLQEAIASEGAAVAFSQRMYPQRPIEEHLRVSPARLRWWRDHEAFLWKEAARLRRAPDPRAIQTLLGGDPRSKLSRCAGYLGCSAIARLLAGPLAGLDAADREVVQSSAARLLRNQV